MENISLMLAGAQLGITICSLLLGRLVEPAVAHLLEGPFDAGSAMPDALLHRSASRSRSSWSASRTWCSARWCPKNIALAGPERAALWLVPPFLAFTTVLRPFISLFNHTANGVLRLMRVEPRDELETAVTSGQLADLIAESGREGLLDDDGSRRLTRTLSSAGHSVADVLVAPVELVSLPQRPVVDDVARAVADTGFSRFPVRAAAGFSGYLHVKDILDIADDPGAEVPSQRIRRLPQVRVTDRLDVALAVLRRAGAHLGRAVDAGGATAGLVTLEDLIEHYVGTVRDATHAREEPA